MRLWRCARRRHDQRSAPVRSPAESPSTRTSHWKEPARTRRHQRRQSCAAIGVAGAATEPTVTSRESRSRGASQCRNPTDPVRTQGLRRRHRDSMGSRRSHRRDRHDQRQRCHGQPRNPDDLRPQRRGSVPDGPCPFARGDGGGIGNYGNLTLIRTTLSDNVAGGPVASDAHGGGIWSAGVGTLTLENSAVTGNESTVAIPNGRFAIGGGVHIQNGGRSRSETASSTATPPAISSIFPTGVDMLSNGGGIHVGDDSKSRSTTQNRPQRGHPRRRRTRTRRHSTPE